MLFLNILHFMSCINFLGVPGCLSWWNVLFFISWLWVRAPRWVEGVLKNKNLKKNFFPPSGFKQQKLTLSWKLLEARSPKSRHHQGYVPCKGLREYLSLLLPTFGSSWSSLACSNITSISAFIWPSSLHLISWCLLSRMSIFGLRHILILYDLILIEQITSTRTISK